MKDEDEDVWKGSVHQFIEIESFFSPLFELFEE